MGEGFNVKVPPASSGGRKSRAPLRERLVARPGVWAYFTAATSSSARSQAYQIRTGRAAWGPKGAFEAMARDVDVRRGASRVREHRVYLRFKAVGDE